MSVLADRVTEWADGCWDEARGLLWNPPGSFDDYALAPRSVHMVPWSAWHAVALLRRRDRANHDETRAHRIIDALCELQYDQPGARWHGTFARFAESPPPGDRAVEWIDYDPNWRQFVGTAFRLILHRFDVPDAVAGRMEHAIELAVAGEPEGRVAPSYSNIALMKAWLGADEDYAAQVVAGFDEHGAFEEYGSPTYYGIDLYALALWRLHPPTPAFQRWGDRLWEALWADVARWWHPGLANLCGPYSRAYGMDLTRYVGMLGLWLPDPAPGPVAPAPETAEHSHDLLMVPVADLLGGGPAELPGAARWSDAERLVCQTLPGGRVATGWLAPGIMIGGEEGGRYRAEGQYHPATAHWVCPDGTVGWLRVRHRGRLSASAGPGTLTIVVHDHHRLGRQPVMVESSHAGTFGRHTWTFPGRTVGYTGPPPTASGVIDAGSDQLLRLELA
jgi:hypothetical protein